MKHYLPLFLLALALIGCENNKEAENTIPAHFSLVGKKYVSENIVAGNGHEWKAVFYFASSDSLIRWETYHLDDVLNPELSPNAEWFEYTFNPPDVYIYHYGYTREKIKYFTFTDSCTFVWRDYTLKLNP